MRSKDLFGRHGHCQGQCASCQALRQAKYIRRHTGLLARQQSPCSSPARHHFVCNEQDTMQGADRAHLGEDLGRIDEHTPCTQDQRLNDESGRPFAACRLQRVESVLRAGSGRKGQSDDVEQQRLVGAVEHAAGADRHRANGVPVIAVLEDKDAMTGLAQVHPVAERHLECDLNTRRARVREENASQRRRHDFGERARKCLRRLVRPSGEYDLIETLSLRRNRRHDSRMAVAVSRDPP